VTVAQERFPSPFEIETPPGAEGWQDLYPYYVSFSEDRRAYEESQFWFQDSIHWGPVMSPWVCTFLEHALASLSQYNTRHYVVPPAMGVDYRVLNGYCYLSPIAITDPEVIEPRVPEFMERAGFYFGNWNDLYERWLVKIREVIAELEAVDFSPLPEREDMAVITEGRGYGSGYQIQEEYHRFKDLCLKVWQYHFEFLNLGYAAYLDFFGFCKQAFPNIPDLAIARMVAGVEVDLFRPTEELKRLAKLAVELGVDTAFDLDGPGAVNAELEGSEAGQRWLASWNETKDPWFNFSAGTGFYHADRVWIEHLEIPYGFVRDYIAQLRAGEDISRPLEQVAAERDRIVEEYSELLGTDEDREAFQGKLGLARTVFPYVENHNFYIEHWAMSVIWRKMRELGATFVKEGFLATEDDIFLIKRDEIDEALYDMFAAWAVGIETRGKVYWPREIERRRGIIEALEAWTPPRALGTPPEVVTEPFTIMLWGITEDSIATMLGAEEGSTDLAGFAASPGTVEGTARVITGADRIHELEEGEILVAPITAPSWAPVFGRVGAVVTDIGGIMSHAAIVCREYGLPAVTGTAFGTRDIKTGQRLRVDGTAGTVTILDS
jgi:pyruvate, water dikinase